VEKRTNGQPKSIRSHGAIDTGRRRRGDHPDVHSHGGLADAMIASGRGWFWRFLVLELARMIGG